MMGDGVAMGREGFEVGAGFGRAEGKFPEAAASGIVSGREEEGVFFEIEEGVFGDLEEGSGRFFGGEGVGGGSLAEVADGAEKAGGLGGGAMGLAEFHEGGVKEARVGLVEEVVGALPEDFLAGGGIDGGGVVEEAGEDAGDVAIDEGGGLVEGEAAESAGGVGADAGEGGEGLGILRETSVEVFDDGAGRFLEVADAVVISESFPGAEDFFFGGGGDFVDVGEGGEEFFESLVGDDRGDGGLLKHDLGDEDGPRVGGLAPGVGFGVFEEPLDEGGAEGAAVFEGMAARGNFFHEGAEG